jgi:hypothetical protein
VTIRVKHVMRKPLTGTNATPAQGWTRNKHLRERFPPRPTEHWWPHTAQPLEETLQRLTSPPFPRGHLAAALAGQRRRSPPPRNLD